MSPSSASAPAQFGLLIGGQTYGGWTSIEVTRSLDAMAGTFEIASTDRWPGQPEQWPVKTGDPVRVTVDGELLLTGWVDEVEPKEEAEDHSIQIKGRGRTGDLVDCSAMNKPGRWSGRKIEQIVSDLCAPFSIAVTVEGDTGAPFKAFAIQQGEAVKEAIDRLVQQRGLLPIETASGDLMLAAPGTMRAAGQLVLGGQGANLVAGEGKHNAAERFSLYVVKGQRQGDNHDHGKAVSQVSATAADPQVTRYRPLMIMAEEQADGGSAADRARFAATIRAARAQTGKLTRTGARDAAGALWAPNRLITVAAANLGLQGDLLIAEVKFKVDGSGAASEIHVTRPEAYSLGEVKGVGLSRLDNSHAGAGAKAPKGRKGRKGKGKGKGAGLDALANLDS
ncbi:MAG: phage baseplate assembly protein [Caulobacteraceae bacterium]